LGAHGLAATANVGGEMAGELLKGENFLRTVQAFVAEKWTPNNPCDRCGTFHWSILPDYAGVLRLRAITPPLGMDHGQASPRYEVEFIPVYCNNCGTTVSIYIEVFMEWLKNRETT
jgi:hypothetical protein